MVTLFGSFFKIFGVIRNCAWWSEITVTRFPEIVASSISLKNMLSISIFELGVMQVGSVIQGTRLFECILFRKSAVPQFDS